MFKSWCVLLQRYNTDHIMILAKSVHWPKRSSPHRPHPLLVISLAGLSAIAIAAGYAHTCAIVAGGGVKCWGDNWNGQLGIGSNENQNRPADVTGAVRPEWIAID